MNYKNCEILYIRHGSTDYTAESKLYEREDFPTLNQKGKNEVLKTAKWIKSSGFNPDIIISSYAQRAIDSAKIISKELNKDFTVAENFHERISGIWGGHNYSEIEEKFPELYREYLKSPYEYTVDGMESISDLHKRVKEAIEKAKRENFDKKILVVSHGAFIKTAVSQALEMHEHNIDRLQIPIASATKIKYYEGWASLSFSGYLP